MNRLTNLFKNKHENVLNVYFTAGFPHLESTFSILEALQESGVDIVEIGIPYSDPIADGPVIQSSNMKALQNGISINLLFDQLKDCRKIIHIPIILMGYLNPIIQYGFEQFCIDAQKVGVDAIILPDLPIYEFETHYGKYLKANDLHFIFLITPETKEERIKKIDALSSGFIYAVSSSSTTGNNNKITVNMTDYLIRLKSMNLKNPVLVGFGIKDKSSFNIASSNSNGAIIGSAFIESLKENTDIRNSTLKFIKNIIQ